MSWTKMNITNIPLYFDTKESDILKVLAACLVVMAHYCAYLLHFDTFSNAVIIKALSAQCGKVGVGIFFMLSGYGLMESHKRAPLSFVAFLKKRLLKIYLPVLCISALYELLCMYIWGGGDFSIKLVTDVCFMHNDPVLWFVRVLILLYVFFDIYVHLKTKTYVKKLIVFFLSAFLIFFLQPYEFASIPLFYLGMYISHKKSWGYSWLFFVGIITCYITSFLVSANSIYLYVFVSYTLIFLLLLLKTWPIFKLPHCLYLPKLSVLSFDVYLVHYKVIAICLFYSFYMQPLLYILVVVATTLIFFKFRMVLNKHTSIHCK